MSKRRKIIVKLSMLSLLYAIICIPIYANASDTSCEHNWILEYRDEASCWDEGYEWYICSKCDEEKEVVLPITPNNHSWSNWTTSGALCSDGYYTRYCRECFLEETKERKGTGNHSWSAWETIIDADCLNEGYDSRWCNNCGKYEKRNTKVNKKAHEWSSWWATKSATALRKGTKTRTCYTCQVKQTKSIPKLKASIKLSATKKTIKKGKSYALKVTKKTYGDKISKYTSNNKKVATVNKKGKIVAKKKGKAKITVTMKSGCKKTCIITVK